MTHSFTTKDNRRYRCYVCNKARQRVWDTCPTPSVPAEEIEQFVVNEIKEIGRHLALVAATVAESRRISGDCHGAVQRVTRYTSLEFINGDPILTSASLVRDPPSGKVSDCAA
jgi:hypothetical protein